MTMKRPRITEIRFMDNLRRLGKPVCHLVAFALLALALHIPVQAALIGTDEIIGIAQGQQDRARIDRLLDREAVQQRLLAGGVDPADVRARVDALSDSEVRALAAKIDELPAGGDGLGLLVFVFIVLLITDILGFTDVFPFVKKPVRR